MALNTLKSNHLTPLHFKGLIITVVKCGMLITVWWWRTNDVTVDAATQSELESWLDAARDVIGVGDVTEARDIVGESRSYLDETRSCQQLATRVRRNGRQRYISHAF